MATETGARNRTELFPKNVISRPSKVFTYRDAKELAATRKVETIEKLLENTLNKLKEYEKNLGENESKVVGIRDYINASNEKIKDDSQSLTKDSTDEEVNVLRDKVLSQDQLNELNKMQTEFIQSKQKLSSSLEGLQSTISKILEHEIVQVEAKLTGELRVLFNDLSEIHKAFVAQSEVEQDGNLKLVKEDLEKILIIKTKVNKIVDKINEVKKEKIIGKADGFREALMEKIKDKIDLAESDIDAEWAMVEGPTVTNDNKGKKAELIEYLKLLYFKNENFNLKKGTVLENRELTSYLEEYPNSLQVVRFIRQLELETNPKAFGKLISNLNLPNIIDRAIEGYQEELQLMDKTIKILIDARNKFLKDIDYAHGNKKREAKTSKKFRETYLDKKLIIKRDNLFRQFCINAIANAIKPHVRYTRQEYQSLIERIGAEYDRVMQLNDTENGFEYNPIGDELVTTFKEKVIGVPDEVLSLRRALIKKYLLGVDPKESYDKVSAENLNPPMTLTAQAAMRKEFERYGASINEEEYLKKLEEEKAFFSRSKLCHNATGERVSLRNLIEKQDVLIRQEVNKGQKDIHYILVQNGVDVPLYLLEECFIGPKKDAIIMNHNKEGDLCSVIEITTKVVNGKSGVIVYTLKKESYSTGTEMQLDSIKKPKVRVGLVMEIEEYEETTQNVVDGKVQEKVVKKTREVYSLSIFCDELPLTDKQRKLIEERYGDRIFQGPDGEEVTVAKLLAEDKIAQKNARKVGTEDSIEDRRNQKSINDLKSSAHELIKDVKGLPVIRNIDNILKGRDARKKEQEMQDRLEKLDKMERLSEFDSSYNIAINNFVSGFNNQDIQDKFSARQNREQEMQVIGQNLQTEDGDQIQLDNDGNLDTDGQMLKLIKSIQEIYQNQDINGVQNLKLREMIKQKIIDAREIQLQLLDLNKNFTILENRYIQPGATLANPPLLLQLLQIALGKTSLGFNADFGIDLRFTNTLRSLVKLNLELGIIKNIIQNPKDYNVGKDLQGYLDKTLTHAMNSLQKGFSREMRFLEEQAARKDYLKTHSKGPTTWIR